MDAFLEIVELPWKMSVTIFGGIHGGISEVISVAILRKNPN